MSESNENNDPKNNNDPKPLEKPSSTSTSTSTSTSSSSSSNPTATVPMTAYQESLPLWAYLEEFGVKVKPEDLEVNSIYYLNEKTQPTIKVKIVEKLTNGSVKIKKLEGRYEGRTEIIDPITYNIIYIFYKVPNSGGKRKTLKKRKRKIHKKRKMSKRA
jgi:hypothetical protein